MKEKGKRKSEKVAIALLFTFSLLVFTSNAVSISSPRIGTFFNLNGMAPNSVPADRTFGSDDATNSTHRLDPQEQAAVNAVFEAYCERVYYGNAGLSNVWNEANYGPECRGGTNLKTFRFNPDAYDGKSSFHYDPDTNRVIRTRRLVEYDNIRNLCGIMTYSDGSDPSGFLYIYRPTWDRVVQWGVYQVRPHWASTLFDGLTLEHGRPETEFPEISWCDKGRFLCRGSGSKDPYYWPNLTLVWDVIGWSDEDPVRWRSNPAWSSSGACIVEDMMWRVQFGDPPHGNDMHTQGYFDFGYSLTNTTMDVVGRGSFAYDEMWKEERKTVYTVRFQSPAQLEGYTLFDELSYSISDAIVSGYPNPHAKSVSGTLYLLVSESPDASASSPVYTAYDGSYDPMTKPCLMGYLSGDLVFTGSDGEPVVVSEYYWGGFRTGVIDVPHVYRDSVQECWWVADSWREGPVIDFNVSFGEDGEVLGVSLLGSEDVADVYVDVRYPVTNVTYRAGLEGLTNETRRLVSDNLAALGLGLSALDRSYCEVAHAIPNVVSNWYGHAERRYSSGPYDAPFGPFVWSDGKWSASLGSDAQVPVLEETEVTDSLNTIGSTSYSDYVVYANPANLAFGVGTFLDPSANPPSPEFPEEEIVARIEDFGPVPDGNSFWTVSAAYFSPAYGGAVAVDVAMTDYQSSYGETTWVFGPPEAPTNSQLETTAYATTGYAFGHTFPAGTRLDRREGIMPYPGDYTRVDRSDPPVLWTAFARCGKFGTDKLHQWTEIYNEYGAMREISYSSAYAPETVCEYSSAVSSPFTSSAQAFAAADSHFLRLANGCSELFESRCGFNFRNPVGMLDFVSAGLNESNTLANVVLGAGTSVEASVGSGRDFGCVSYFFVVGNGFGRVGEIHAMYFDDVDPVERPFPARLYSISYSLSDDTHVKEGHEPGGRDFHGGAVAGRMTSLSRVNWDWKALKRERNNQ